MFLVTKALKTVREARGLTSGSHHKYLWRCFINYMMICRILCNVIII